MSHDVGDHVVATRDHEDWAGRTLVRRGTRGIVRETPAGWFSDRYKVEFLRGGVVAIRGRDLRRTWTGACGETQWRRYRETRLGISLGLFLVFTLPALIGLVPYYLHGGTTAELVGALPPALLQAGLELVGAIGLPLTAVVLVVLWLRTR